MSTMLRGQHDGLVWGSKNSTVAGPGKGARGKQRAGKGTLPEAAAKRPARRCPRKRLYRAAHIPKKRITLCAWPGAGGKRGNAQVRNIVQRERRFVCGKTRQDAKYMEVEIYTVAAGAAGQQREAEIAKGPPFRGKNPEKWSGHNAARARKWFTRLINTNFTEADTHTTLTYTDETLPTDPEQAARDAANFLRHVRERCKEQGLPRPEAITVTEYQDADPDTGQRAVRYHHHILLHCGLTRDEIEACWHRRGKRLGRANADRLQMNKQSLEALAGYLLKYANRKHRWRRTSGIEDPITPRPNDSKYTRRGIERIATDAGRLHSPEFWAGKYPGWALSEAVAVYNEYWGWAITLKMHRPPGGTRGARTCG